MRHLALRQLPAARVQLRFDVRDFAFQPMLAFVHLPFERLEDLLTALLVAAITVVTVEQEGRVHAKEDDE